MSISYIMEPYDESLRFILKNGVRKANRTGVDTLSVFGLQSRYRIDDRFPVLTGRKVWPKAIFAELIWFLSGSTNNKDLQELNSNIWTNWVDREFEKKHNYAEGSLGPIYGFQLRHFGGEYSNGESLKQQYEDFENSYSYTLNYGYKGFDQLEYMINELRTNPDSRRNLFSLWNPKDLNKQRLACCHYSFQVYVHENKLSGLLTQRSADFPIGVPSNILFYSALLYLLAQQTGYQPYELIHNTGDSHIYVNQIDAVNEYLLRNMPDSPRLEVKQEKHINDYTPESFLLKDYHPLNVIKITVAI